MIEIKQVSSVSWAMVNKENGSFVNGRTFPKGGALVIVSESYTIIQLGTETEFEIKNATLEAPTYTDITDLYNQLEAIVN